MPITRAYASAAQPGNAFLAGKNKIINGDFGINQRNFTSLTSNGFGFDRWNFITNSGTVTHTPQTFTAGAAPVAGYEGSYFARIVTSGQTGAGAYTIYRQNIENVRNFAGQTATFSFWAKANSGTPKIALELEQNFGTGGSPSAGVIVGGGQVTISTSWARYSITVAVPSLSGKTVGTTDNTSSLTVSLWVSAGTDFNARTGSMGIQSNTFDIWGVQAEAGSVATAFQTATGTLAGELAACQRYYYRNNPAQTSRALTTGFAFSTTVGRGVVKFPVTMRTIPSALEQSGTASDYQIQDTSATTACSAVPAYVTATFEEGYVSFTVASGLTAGQGLALRTATANAYLGWSAEL